MLGLVNLLLAVLQIYSLVIFVYVLLSWIPNKVGILVEIDNFLGKVCDPFLNIFKKFIPPIGGMVDISPIIALIVLQLAGRLIVSIF
ncbi:MAG: YggT family protein [Eggerthellaceae bacterium]|nr:YggT family protein [Eggerthellaceae bacterium]